MINFIQSYWREILAVVTAIISIVVFIVRKRPVRVVDTLNEIICRLLPYCISVAESAPKGEKLDVCISALVQLLAEMDYELDEDHKKFAIEQVEVILSTPQKKEKKNER